MAELGEYLSPTVRTAATVTLAGYRSATQLEDFDGGGQAARWAERLAQMLGYVLATVPDRVAAQNAAAAPIGANRRAGARRSRSLERSVP